MKDGKLVMGRENDFERICFVTPEGQAVFQDGREKDESKASYTQKVNETRKSYVAEPSYSNILKKPMGAVKAAEELNAPLILQIAEGRLRYSPLELLGPIMNMGGLGETGGLAANLIAKEADLVIGIGTRYTDFTTSSKWLYQNPDVNFININVSEFHG